MSLSKKIRFEVFKRDGFMCQYCGGSPPGSTLEVDHVQPSSKGGTNEINNLLTACFDCNRGKSNIPLTTIPGGLQDNLEILKEKEDQLKEYNKILAKIRRRVQKDINDIDKFYNSIYPKFVLSDRFKNVSLKTFLKHLTKDQIIDAFRIAEDRLDDHIDDKSSRVITYTCKICWNWIKGVRYPE